ncbi:hypothetical protein SAMN05216350_101178 [Polaromonas sp. YR568]|uniref:hypothetical protein n=1 Tax=Polaromonas sp. YR568 TaxID=1855301 RepID=UPI0008E21986|nr:hypothetical protein [Polaromonas sp. YR568]SFU29774.1 hypothetical protein SAMN05216350_101178 [Polaromonas sp. YR568]
MKRCSWWVIVGFALLVLTLVGLGAGEWYARNFIPDTPVRTDGKFIHSPRSDALLSIWLLSTAALVLSAFTSVIGLFIGPRTRACLLAGLAAPLLLCLVLATPSIVSIVQQVKRAL